ncbi:hypothetical protein H0H81_004212 [Sphagnurus paluster]|uniref:Uncharacterized protein n=1 Tax=Sphagnurus paluster TaxID=117069 RepID=A0A9P7GMB1_9AGAR|nr:hypothetical protein H0H81_004212 [Sphagnurus paluster]
MSSDIRTTPLYKGKVHSDFMRECTCALELCYNLHSFTYTPTANTPILPILQKRDRLRELRIAARFTTSQAATLAKVRKLEKLELDYGSWEVMDILPTWAASLQKTLTSLTLFMPSELNMGVLEAALIHLPRLLGLHVMGCPSIDHVKVMKLVSQTPMLESLAFSITETATPPTLPFPPPSLSHLRHLALDVRGGLTANPASAATLLSVLTSIKTSFPSLESVALKVPDLKPEASHELVKKLLEQHEQTLRRLVFIDAIIEIKSISEICRRCLKLKVLSLPLPMKEIV